MVRSALTWLLPLIVALLSWTQREDAEGRVPADPPQLSSTVARASIDPLLMKQVIAGGSEDQYRFIVVLHDQADLTSLPDGLAREDSRNQLVARLQTTATHSQAGLLAFLQAQQASRKVQQIRPFWVFNGISVTGDADTLLALASHPDVRLIQEDRWRRWVDGSSVSEGRSTQLASDTEWNIEQIRADDAWNALGLDGSGVTVAVMDTGVDWQHPALQSKYRGYKPDGLANHLGNWFCATDEGYLYPVDGNGHGTHITGTAVGGRDEEGTAIGVAPGARWIAVKMLNDAGYGYDSWIHAAFEWLLAPAGDPDLAPEVVNGSWGGPAGADETFRLDLQALRAAGIVPVFAAGNTGPAPYSIGSPGSYPEAIAVGATDSLDHVADFSSRGPSPWGEVKPEIVAPGTYIRSSLPGGTYGTHSGTSMATPHVTGLVAILIQADPALMAGEIEDLLKATATPLGSESPNNDSGSGRIDAYWAAATALQAGYIEGQITRQPDGEPLPTAQVSASDHEGANLASVGTDQAGYYRLALPPGRYALDIEAFAYAPQTIPLVVVETASTTILDRTMSPLPAGVLWGRISDAQTDGPVGADLRIGGTPAQTTSDSDTGQYSLALPVGTYALEISRNGYRRHVAEDIEIVADQAERLDVALSPAPTLLLMDSGEWYYGSQIHYFEQALYDGSYVYDLWKIRDLHTDLPDLDVLRSYDVTIWSSPLDAPGLIGAADIISGYLGIGGRLFLSGQDIGYWDGGLSGLPRQPYYPDLLKAKAVADDAGRADIVGLPDGILHDLRLPINGPRSAQNQSAPDQITLADGRGAAIDASYSDGGDAAIRAAGCQSYRAVYLASGLEGLGDYATRASVMERVVDWLDAPHPAVAAGLYPTRQDQVWLGGATISYTIDLLNAGQATDQFTLEATSSGWPASVWDETFGQPITQSLTLSPCQTQTVGIQVIVPTGVEWNVTNTVTLTARSETSPDQAAAAMFYSKAPAPILLVNDHRWYDTVGEYQSALEASTLPYDLWTIPLGPHPETGSPPLSRLQRHRIVLWFTSYDWYATLVPTDEEQLATYLDGGGRLLLSSQDYLYTSGFTGFAKTYLGVAGYTEALTATQVVAARGSPVGEGLDFVNLYYPFRNWSDALQASEHAQPALWGQHAQPVALTLDQAPWKTAFFSFPLETLPEQDLADLISRSMGWLSPLGDSVLNVDRSAAAEGDELAYTLLARNTGPALLSQVVMSNTLPVNTSLVPGTLQGPATYDAATRRLTWVGAIAPGDQVEVRYRLLLDSPMPEGITVRNVAHLADESGLALDRTAKTRVNAPDLSHSTMSASARAAVPGETIVYTFNLSNNGTRSAQVRLTNPVPLNTEYRPGTAWASAGTLTDSGDLVSWAGTMAPGESVILEIPVVPAPSSAASYILNRATLSDGSGESHILEAYTWIHVHLYFPIIGRH